MICPNCNVQMVRRKSKFGASYWWGCPNYPNCRVTSSEHPDGSMMSTPATEEVKQLRIQAHRIAEQIWGEWDSPRCKRNEMYDWLKYNTKSGHIGMMDKPELLKLIENLKIILQYKVIR